MDRGHNLRGDDDEMVCRMVGCRIEGLSALPLAVIPRVVKLKREDGEFRSAQKLLKCLHTNASIG